LTAEEIIKKKSWIVNKLEDGIIFTPKTDVRIVGIGVYAPIGSPTRFAMICRFKIQKSPNGP